MPAGRSWPLVFGHHLVEAAEALVGNAAAFAEAAHYVVFDCTEKRNVLRENGEIAVWRTACDQGSVLWRQGVGAGFAIVVDDFTDGRRAQPFAHIALLQPGFLRDLGAGGRHHACHRVEQTRSVADRKHQVQRASV